MKYDFDDVDLGMLIIGGIVVTALFVLPTHQLETAITGAITAIAALARGKQRNGNGGG